MNSFCKYLLILIGIAALGYVLWYFFSIVVYILVAAVLTLVGRPVASRLNRVKAGRFRFPSALSAVLTLIVIWTLIIGFFRIFVPLIANQANELSQVDTEQLVNTLEQPLKKIEAFYNNYYASREDAPTFREYINNKVTSLLNVAFLSNFFSSIFSILGNVFIAIFAISFITFFFLRDRGILSESLVLLIPEKHEAAVRNAIQSVKYLLRRYFVGICGQITGIMTLVTLGMVIVGLDFRDALLIALVAGLLNVVPYLGPLIGSTIGLFLGMAANIQMDFASGLLPLLIYMLMVFVFVQIIDNVLFQPLIFGSSVKAHPLEIFLVIMIAGSLAGIPGMIMAIPTYTVSRVFAREFFSRFRVVQRLTRNI